MRKVLRTVVAIGNAMRIQRCFPERRDVLFGLVVFVLLGNVTFFSFLWGERTLQNSVVSSSIYESGTLPGAIDYRWLREFDPFGGELQTEPWFALEREQIVGLHRAPLWNPYSGYGMPLAANMQSQPYSPFAWVSLILPTARGYDAFIALRLIAAGFLAFLYLRTFVGRIAAFAGGSAYMFTGYLWLYLSLPEVSVEVLTPGLLLAAECVVRRPSLRSMAGLGAMSGLSLLGGMPESSALAIGLTLAYAAARILGNSECRATGRLATRYLVCGLALGAGLSAIQVIPFLEYVVASSNSHGVGSSNDVPNMPPEQISMPALALYLAPLMFGPPDDSQTIVPGKPQAVVRGFFGSAAAFFALLAVFSSLDDLIRRRPRGSMPVFFFAIVAAIFLTRRFGFALTAPIGALPIVREILLYKYEEALIGVSVAALVAFGIARLCERRFTPATAVPAGVLPLVVLVLAQLYGHDLAAHGEAKTHVHALAASCTFLVSACLLAALALGRRTLAGRAIAATSLVLVALELPLVFVIPSYYGANAGAFQRSSPLLGAPYLTFLAQHMENGERFYGERQLLTPNWSAAFGVPDVRGVDALYPSRYFSFARAFLGDFDRFELHVLFVGTSRIDPTLALPRRFLELSSVRYYGVDKTALKPPPTPLPGAQLVYTSPHADVYDLPLTVPRAALYRRIVLARDGPDALRILRSPGFSPTREAVVEEGDATQAVAAFAQNPAEPVRAGTFESDASGDERVSVQTSAGAVLVVNDTYFPGWNATIDGRTAPILRANYLFRAVVVPPGKHVVAFSYLPMSFCFGAVITLASFLALAYFATRSRAIMSS